jgi:4-diphosphocytidyl-2-C-methyl-D-erythritol kinase
VVEPLGELPSFWVILAKPKVSVSTPTILRAVDDTNKGAAPDTERVLSGIAHADFEEMVAGMANVLEAVTAARYPEITALKQRLTKYGAQVAQMSGSGPTVFGLCAKKSRAVHVYNSMKGFCKEVYLVHTL